MFSYHSVLLNATCWAFNCHHFVSFLRVEQTKTQTCSEFVSLDSKILDSKTTNHTVVCHRSTRTLFPMKLFWISLTHPPAFTEVSGPTPSCHSPHPAPLPPLFSPLSSAPAPLPDCFQSFLREEALDFFCSQCHKQISRLEDLSTRLNFLEMTR